jgi:hypothetical protein
VLANNVLYSRDGNALNFPNGREGVILTGNVIVGHGPKEGTSPGRGLEDFVSMTWDGEKHDAKPSVEAPFEKADAKFLLETDLTHRPRTDAMSGALAR